MSSAEDLRPDWDEIIIGGGVSGLLCAWVAARAGLRVLLLEASAEFGGAVGLMDLEPHPGHRGRALPAGLRTELGAESFATKSPSVPALLEDLGLAGDISPVFPQGSWIVDALPGGLRALPSPGLSLFGIPGDLTAEDVVAFLGEDDADAAAALDSAALDPSLLERGVSIGRLVRERLGETVLERLVSPVVSGVYSAAPDELEASRIHPRLLAALEDAGSLSGAVAHLRSSMSAGAAVAGLAGGIGRIVEELRDQALAAGAELRTGVRVDRLSRRADGTIAVVPAGEAHEAARRVTLAVPADSGTALLESLAPGLTAGERGGFEQGEEIILVTLAFAAGTPSAEALAMRPRGSGLLVAPSARGPERSLAKALTHSSAKWPWMRPVLEGAEVIRLSINAADLEAAGIDAGDREVLVARALADAVLLMGADLAAEDLAASGVASHRNTAPLLRSAGPEESPSARLERWLEDPRTDGVRAVGSWRAGTGLAAVVSQARSSRF